MTELWPHLPEVIGESLFQEARNGQTLRPAVSHVDQVWAPIGARVRDRRIRELTEMVTKVATEHGFPDDSRPGSRILFDRQAAPLLYREMELTWAEAGNRELWSFVALIVLPDVTHWRFGANNRERWLASDLTRHTWSRLWWQAVVFAGKFDLLDQLSESDLNALLERRIIGGDPRLTTAMAASVVAVTQTTGRRDVIRYVTPLLRRYLAFVDVRALDDYQLEDWCQRMCQEALRRLQSGQAT